MEKSKKNAMKKRMLSVFLGMLVLFSALIFANITSFAAYSGRSGDYGYYVNNGELEITDYYGSSYYVTIPSYIDGYPVRTIGFGSFSSCSSVRSVTIPSTVTTIGQSSFNRCYNLISVSIPSSVKTIGSYAFSDDSSLTSISIPNSVTSIGERAFSNCVSLQSINIPNGITTLSSNLFSLCTSLTSVSLPSTLTSIGFESFYGCSSLTSIAIPSKVTSIGAGAFNRCSNLISVNIPNGVTSLGDNTFKCCYGLTSFTIPSNIKRLGSNVFEECTSLTKITIPDSVTSMGDNVFKGCSGLTKVTIPNSVKSMGSYTFRDCTSLTNATLPSGITSLQGTFAYCSSLKSFTIPSNITKIGDSAFSNCSNLKSITIPSSVTSIGSSAFMDCDGITSIIIPNSVTSIGSDAFWGCDGITSINIPNSVTDMGDGVFSWCSKLKSVTLPNKITSIEKSFFDRCHSLISIDIPNSVTSIGDYAFSFCDSLKNIIIPSSVTSIGDKAFLMCTDLTHITIPNSVTSISDYSFSDCSGLSTVLIPKSVKSIGLHAFDECLALKHVYYTGSSAQWNEITISDYNDPLNKTTKHYNFDPTNLATPKISAVANTATGVKVSWNKVTCADKYRVFYKTAGDSNWHKAGDSTSTNFIWTGAKSGTKYTFTVRCVSGDGKTYISSFNKTGKSITYIAAPKLSSVANTTTGVQIKWGKVTGAAKYRVFYKTGNGGWKKLADTTSTSYTWKGAKSGTKYTFTVRCVDKDGKNFTSAYNTTGKSITYVAAPKLSKAENTATGVKITWAKSTGAAKYRVFYKTGNSSWKKLADTTSTNYTWKGAKSGTKYTFTVRCVDKDGKNFTSAYNTTGKSITYVAAPKLSKVENTATGIKITWAKSTGAAKYRVFYKTGNGNWTKLADTTSTSYTWTKAKSGTKYTFTVRCISKDGKSYTSSYDNKGKSITFLSAPKISSLTKSSSGITVKWGKVTGAVNYKVFRKTANGSWTAIGTTTGTSFVDKTAKKGTKYTYTVRCISKDGKTYTSAYDTKGKSITR